MSRLSGCTAVVVIQVSRVSVCVFESRIRHLRVLRDRPNANSRNQSSQDGTRAGGRTWVIVSQCCRVVLDGKYLFYTISWGTLIVISFSWWAATRSSSSTTTRSSWARAASLSDALVRLMCNKAGGILTGRSSMISSRLLSMFEIVYVSCVSDPV